MHRFLLATVAFAALSTTASAADLPRASAPPVIAVAPIFTWTGFYVGLNAGAGFTNGGSVGAATGFAAPAAAALQFPGRSNDATFLIGATIGYNWQFGNIVAGVEGDLGYLFSNGRRDATILGVPATGFGPGAPPNTATLTGGDRDQLFGTARVRLGFAFDRALLYATGGVAFRERQRADSVQIIAAGGVVFPGLWSNGGGETVGWTLGGGLEYAITNNWSIKGEYLYANFGNGDRVLTNPLFPGVTFESGRKSDVHVVRGGINYRF
jgi:outer membrane immunogenic protein